MRREGPYSLHSTGAGPVSQVRSHTRHTASIMPISHKHDTHGITYAHTPHEREYGRGTDCPLTRAIAQQASLSI
eukprot:2254273-Prymnesium_polylepis.1